MLTNPFDTLKKMIDQPSGSWDREDVARVASMFAEEFEGLGFAVTTVPGSTFGPKLVCDIGNGPKKLLMMGHMDTVFLHDVAVPYTDMGDGTIRGSGINDMKGGVVVMLYALQQVLPQLDLNTYSIRVVLNADEEVGSPESHDLILENARQSFAVLSFEPCGINGRLTCARKGVTSVEITCTGKPGHAGAEYKKCASAIQALCAQITKLYTLRDDDREISFNAGFITGGTAENVVAPKASCKCEFRYFNQSYQAMLIEKIKEITADEPVPGAVTTLNFGASHPAIDLNEKSEVLLKIALDVASEQGLERFHERTGGAGDIAIAGQAGVGVLDGLGICGGKMHTVEEFCYKDQVIPSINYAAEIIRRVCP